MVGQVELTGVTNLSQGGSASFSWRGIIGNNTVLPDIHTDGVRRGDVSIGRFHGSTGIPHVKEEENRDRREAKDCEEGQEEDVGQEHEEGGDAASTDGGLEVTLQLLLDGAGGVKALSQQDDCVDKEEGANAIDDVLKNLNHHSEGGVVARYPGEVILQHGMSPSQRYVATSAEQSHAYEAEDGGHQRGIGHPAQTLDAALEASFALLSLVLSLLCVGLHGRLCPVHYFRGV